MANQIPEIIHYCWFGNTPLPPLEEKCIKSWEIYLPDYEIKRWDETTFDVSSHWFTRRAYQKKKYAFVSDYVRLRALQQYGGIYLDADTELIKPLDPFLKNPAFCGFQDDRFVSAGVLGARQGSEWIEEMLKLYDSEPFRQNKNGHFAIPNTVWFTNYFLEKGLKLNNSKQEAGGVVVYPKHIFNPKKHDDIHYTLDDETVAIHHFALSWLPWHKKYRLMFKKHILKKYFPGLLNPIYNMYKKFI